MKSEKLLIENIVINLTPHEINFWFDKDGNEQVPVPSSGLIRRSVKSVQIGMVSNIPIFETVYGELDKPELLKPVKGCIFVVSMLVATDPSLKDRKDIFVPNDLVRNTKGMIIGCGSLSRA